MPNLTAEVISVYPSPVSWKPLTGPSRAVALEILLRGPLSRSELARRLDLSPGSLTRLAKPLLDSGVLAEGGVQREARSGRPSRPLDIVPDAHHFVGIKLTDDEAHGVVTTLRAGVITSAKAALPGREPAAVVAAVRNLAQTLGTRVPHVTALGVSLGGHVRDHALVTRAPFLAWTDEVPLAAMLEEATALPTVVDNDLLALTRAEHWFGAAQDSSHFAVLTIGAGIGCGLVVHDQVVESPDAGLGLVGHHPLDPLGPPCPSGHRGCASAMLSIPSIRSWISVGLRRAVTYDECLDLAAAGNPVAASAITDSGRALGRLIAAVANLTMSPRIILTGEGVRLADIAAEAVSDGIHRDRDPRAAPLSIDVQPSDFAEWARGAAVTAIQTSIQDVSFLDGRDGTH